MSLEIKVSDMTLLTSIPDDAKIYIVKPGDTTPYYITKAALVDSFVKISKIIFNELAVTVPAGFTGAVINLTQPNSTVTYTVSGTSMTITGGADDGDVLIF